MSFTDLNAYASRAVGLYSCWRLSTRDSTDGPRKCISTFRFLWSQTFSLCNRLSVKSHAYSLIILIYAHSNGSRPPRRQRRRRLPRMRRTCFAISPRKRCVWWMGFYKIDMLEKSRKMSLLPTFCFPLTPLCAFLYIHWRECFHLFISLFFRIFFVTHWSWNPPNAWRT